MLLYKKIKVVSITFSALPEQFSTGNMIFEDVDLAFTIFRIVLPVFYEFSFVRKRLKHEDLKGSMEIKRIKPVTYI